MTLDHPVIRFQDRVPIELAPTGPGRVPIDPVSGRRTAAKYSNTANTRHLHRRPDDFGERQVPLRAGDAAPLQAGAGTTAGSTRRSQFWSQLSVSATVRADTETPAARSAHPRVTSLSDVEKARPASYWPPPDGTLARVPISSVER